MGPTPRRRLPSIVAVVLAVVALPLLLNVATGTISVSGWLAWGVWGAVAVLAVVVVVTELRRQAAGAEPALPDAAQEVARRLLAEYSDQEYHALAGSALLTVGITVTDRRGRRPVVTSDVSQIAAVHGGVPGGRLLIVGGPGAGKTLLALALCRSLLPAVSQGGPVPVLIPISSWDPVAESAPEFIIRRLHESHRVLASAAANRRLIARLVTEPRLDGDGARASSCSPASSP